MSLPLNPRAPGGRASAGKNHVEIIERATALITELGARLDREVLTDARESEKLRMLREATNQITRAANDAVAAYRAGLRTLNLEIERAGPDVAIAIETRERLRTARTDLLQALDEANRRYPAKEAPVVEVTIPDEG